MMSVLDNAPYTENDTEKSQLTLDDLKKIHNLKVESYLCFIWWECVGLQTQETASQVTLRELFQGGERRNQVIQKFYNKVQVVWTQKNMVN